MRVYTPHFSILFEFLEKKNQKLKVVKEKSEGQRSEGKNLAYTNGILIGRDSLPKKFPAVFRLRRNIYPSESS